MDQLHLTRAGPERVGQGVGAAFPVGGLLAHHHPHRDPIHIPSRPDPHDPGEPFVAVETAAEPGEHHRGPPPQPVGPRRTPRPPQHPPRRRIKRSPVGVLPHRQPRPHRDHRHDRRHRSVLHAQGHERGDGEGDEGPAGQPPGQAGGAGPGLAGRASRPRGRDPPQAQQVVGHRHRQPSRLAPHVSCSSAWSSQCSQVAGRHRHQRPGERHVLARLIHPPIARRGTTSGCGPAVVLVEAAFHGRPPAQAPHQHHRGQHRGGDRLAHDLDRHPHHHQRHDHRHQPPGQPPAPPGPAGPAGLVCGSWPPPHRARPRRRGPRSRPRPSRPSRDRARP